MSLKLFIKFISISAIFALTPAAFAGEITRSDNSDFQWKSTECPRPIPALPSSGLSKQERLLRYARDIEVYIDCIQREAQRDFEKAQIAMQRAIESDLEQQTNTMNGMMQQAVKTIR